MSIRRTILSAAVAAVLWAGPAHADPIIEFSTGSAGEGGAIARFGDDGEHLWGMYIPISTMTISGAPMNNGTYSVTGQPWRPAGAGYLAFDTRYPRDISIFGCVPDIRNVGWLDANGECGAEDTLMSGTILGWDRALMPDGLVDAFGDAFINLTLVRALGTENQQYIFAGDALSTRELMPGTLASVNDSYIRNIPAVPEPGTMVLLGTGLLAAFRTRRRRRP